MISPNPLLSICIPTYNRGALLENCLRSVIADVAAFAVPICVSDNGSTDDTDARVRALQQSHYPHLTYQKVPTNEGIDRNIVRAVSMASTPYAWIFGDDDEMVPGAIARVLHVLAEQPAVVVVNRTEYSPDLQVVLKEQTLEAKNDRRINDAEDLLVACAWYVTFVGALVVNVGYWSTVRAERYFDTDFVHVGVVYEYFKTGMLGVVLAAPLIRCRTGTNSWSERVYEVWVRNWGATVWRLPSRYGLRAKRTVIRYFLDPIVLMLLSARAAGRYDVREFGQNIMPNYSVLHPRAMLALAAALVPRNLAIAITRLQRFVRRKGGFRAAWRPAQGSEARP
jgi:abequosyltransferase